MSNFSVRNGYKNDISTDDQIRNSIWNKIFLKFLKIQYVYVDSPQDLFFINIWTQFFNELIDEMPRKILLTYYVPTDLNYYIKKKYLNSKWNEIFDLLEFLFPYLDDFSKDIEEIFKQNNFKIRVINDQIIIVDSDVEHEELKSDLSTINFNSNTKKHLDSAIHYLYDRNHPDYRNSMKESISAIEALAREICNSNDDLGKLIPKISEIYNYHPTFKKALTNIYAYTSDEGGVRHSFKLDAKETTFDDAKFFLHICSAFTSYLNTANRK